MRLKGKVAIVTGASRGLGRAYSLGMAREGARIVATDITEGIKDVVAEIKALGGEAVSLRGDVTSESDTLDMARLAFEKFGQIDILVNNAAIYDGIGKKPFYDISTKEWDWVIGVNLKGPWLCAKAVFPYMRDQGGGKIINISSTTFFTGSFYKYAHYVTSKGGVIGLTRTLAREMGEYNICVNAIAPGFTDTEASRNLVPQIDKFDVSLNCLKRLGQTSDLVGLVIFLASDDSNYITGQTLLVDGGRIMQ